VAPSIGAVDEDGRVGERTENVVTVLRIEQLPSDLGWLLVYAGILGVIVPGILGCPSWLPAPWF
jgi:hypothetical protein